MISSVHEAHHLKLELTRGQLRTRLATPPKRRNCPSVDNEVVSSLCRFGADMAAETREQIATRNNY